jgi:hypothetical protein
VIKASRNANSISMRIAPRPPRWGIGLPGTEYAKATCGTICLKLLKIGALVRVSVRRIKVAMATVCPAA